MELETKGSAAGLEVGGELEDSSFSADVLLWSVKGIGNHGDARNRIAVDASGETSGGWRRHVGGQICAEGLGWSTAGCSAVGHRHGIKGEQSVSLVQQLDVLVDVCFDLGAFCLIAAGGERRD